MSVDSVQFVSLMSGLPWGGCEELWSRTAHVLLARDIDVSVLSKKWKHTPAQIRSLADKGVRVGHYRDGLPNRIRSGLIRRGIRARWPFRYLWQSDVTVVSLGTFADVRWYLPAADELLHGRSRFIVLVHAAPPLPESLSDSEKIFLGRFYLSAEKVFFVADANRSVAEQMLGFKIPGSELINNPFRVPMMSPPNWPDSTSLRLVCPARIDLPVKGQDVLLRALAKNWSDRDFELLFYGAGPDVEKLGSLIRENGFEGRAWFAGFAHDVGEIYKDAHAMVLTSHSEGMPIVCVEAALSARPGLVTDVGDSKRAFRDGAAGFVAESPEVDAVVEALERLWESREQLRQMGQVAYEDALRNFSEDGVEKLIRQIGV